MNLYTSRSVVESFQDCPRYRFNQYHLGGKGVVPVRKSIPLVTGTAVHKGIEHLLCRVRIGEVPDVDTAVSIAVRTFVDECGEVGFRGKGVETDRQQLFTFEEQKALTEGLVRAWYLRELPKITDRYKVIAVERDLEPFEIAPGVWFQVKVDAELQEIATGDYHNYSIKTAKTWNERSENSYKSDLQGLTEIWGVEEDAKRFNTYTDIAFQHIAKMEAVSQYAPKQLVQIKNYLDKIKIDKQVSGVRFCILIKGERKKPTYNAEDPDALYITYSPLIRGYKNITPTSVNYAHSWFYPNPENKSGKSILGKGWEPFNVWESDISIKQWIEALAEERIQPECGDIISQQVMTPIEYFRDAGEIETGMREVAYQEARVKTALEEMQGGILEDKVLNETFPHVRKHCEFHFGSACEYKELCWQPEIGNDPLGSGLYEVRTPHHDREREVNR